MGHHHSLETLDYALTWVMVILCIVFIGGAYYVYEKVERGLNALREKE